MSSLLLLGGVSLAAQDTGKGSTGRLIERLGAEDYTVRKAAEKALLRRGKAALEALRKSAKGHDDPEVQWRAGRLVRRIEAGDRPGRRTLGKRDSAKRDSVKPGDRGGQASGPRQDTDLHRRVEDIMEDLDRAFEGHGFGSGVQREIDRAMKQMHEALRRARVGGGFHVVKPFGQGSVTSRSKSIKIDQGPDGVRVEVTEKGDDGKEEKKIYEAEDLESLKKAHPGLLDDGGVRIHLGEVFDRGFPHAFGGRVFRPRIFRDGHRFEIELDSVDRKSGGHRTSRTDHEDEAVRTGRASKRKTLRKRSRQGGREKIEEVGASDRKRLGFYVGTIPPSVREYLDLEGGLMVDRVVDDSLATKLGLRKGDIVIKVGKKPVAAPDDVSDALESIGSGKVTVEVVRRGRQLTLR